MSRVAVAPSEVRVLDGGHRHCVVRVARRVCVAVVAVLVSRAALERVTAATREVVPLEVKLVIAKLARRSGPHASRRHRNTAAVC